MTGSTKQLQLQREHKRLYLGLRSRGIPGHEYIHKAKILVGVLL